MKKIYLLIIAFLMVVFPTVVNADLNEEMAAANTRLRAKLEEIFPNGKLTINVSSSYQKEKYDELDPEIKSMTSYESFIEGGLLELYQIHFGDYNEIDTGIVSDGVKVKAYSQIMPAGTYNENTNAAFFYSVPTGCDSQNRCTFVPNQVVIPIDVELNITDADDESEKIISEYKANIQNVGRLKYDDLNWINMLLATELEGIFADQLIKGTAAKYLFAPITKLNDKVDVYIDNRMGELMVVNDANWDDNNMTEIVFSGEYPVMKDNVFYDNLAGLGFNIYYGNIIYIPDDTPQDKYEEAVEKRLNEYINNSAYEINVTKSIYNITDHYPYSVNSNYLTGALPDFYNLNMKHNNESYDYKFVIKKVPVADIKVPVVNYVEEGTKIIMNTTSSDIPANSIIKVNVISDNSSRQKDIKDVLKTDKVVSYEIDLEGSNGYIKKINNGVVTIKIPLPEGFDKEITEMYYVSEDGKDVQKLPMTFEVIAGVEYLVFSTDHFSTYVVAEKKPAAPVETPVVPEEVTPTPVATIENPKTYDSILNSVIVLSVSIMLIGLTTVYFKKRTAK